MLVCCVLGCVIEVGPSGLVDAVPAPPLVRPEAVPPLPEVVPPELDAADPPIPPAPDAATITAGAGLVSSQAKVSANSANAAPNRRISVWRTIDMVIVPIRLREL